MTIDELDRRAVLKLVGGLSLGGVGSLAGCTETLDAVGGSGTPAYVNWIPDDGSATAYTYVETEAAAGDDADVEGGAGTHEFPGDRPLVFAYPLLGAVTTVASGVLAPLDLNDDGTVTYEELAGSDVSAVLRVDDTYVLEGAFGSDDVLLRLEDGFEEVGSYEDYTLYRLEEDWWVFSREVAVAVAGGTAVVDPGGDTERIRALLETDAGERERRYDADAEFAASVDAVGDLPVVRGRVGPSSPLFRSHSVFGDARVVVSGVTPDANTATLAAEYETADAVPDAETLRVDLGRSLREELASSVDDGLSNVALEFGDGSIDVTVETAGADVSVSVDDADTDGDRTATPTESEPETPVDVSVEETSVRADATRQ